MTAVQRRRRALAAAIGAMAVPVLLPHWLSGDGLWLLTVLAVGTWAAANFRAVR